MTDTRSEAEIKAAVRLKFSQCGVVIFNSPTAQATLDSGRRMRVGLCRGASDLIGIQKLTGRFVAAEIKTRSGLVAHKSAFERAWSRKEAKAPLSEAELRAFEQQQFLDLISRSGGISGIITHEDQVPGILEP